MKKGDINIPIIIGDRKKSDEKLLEGGAEVRRFVEDEGRGEVRERIHLSDKQLKIAEKDMLEIYLEVYKEIAKEKLYIERSQNILAELEKKAYFLFNSEKTANNEYEINKDIEAYIGEINPKVMESIIRYGVENIYEKKPDGDVVNISMRIKSGGESKTQLFDKTKVYNIHFYGNGVRDALESLPFNTSSNEDRDNVTLVFLTKQQLGLSEKATVGEALEAGDSIGLHRCQMGDLINATTKLLDLWPNHLSYIATETIPGKEASVFFVDSLLSDSSFVHLRNISDGLLSDVHIMFRLPQPQKTE